MIKTTLIVGYIGLCAVIFGVTLDLYSEHTHIGPYKILVQNTTSTDSDKEEFNKFAEHCYRPWTVYTDGRNHYRVTDGNGRMYDNNLPDPTSAEEVIRRIQLIIDFAASQHESKDTLPHQWEKYTRTL